MSEVDQQAVIKQQHEDWMRVTATAVNQLHRSDGYKGVAQGELIRPRPAQGKKR